MAENKELPIIDDNYRMKICKMGQGGKCCRYLVLGAKGFECAKGSSMATAIDSRVERGQFTSKGDNCDGYQVEQAKLN